MAFPFPYVSVYTLRKSDVYAFDHPRTARTAMQGFCLCKILIQSFKYAFYDIIQNSNTSCSIICHMKTYTQTKLSIKNFLWYGMDVKV